jgi:hypothetical protein
MQFTLNGPRGSDTPYSLQGDGRRTVATEDAAAAATAPDHVILACFEAHSWESALSQFHQARKAGIAATFADRFGRDDPGRRWRFRGSPHYLNRQAIRLQVSQVVTDKAAGNPDIHRISTLVGQCQERYSAVKRHGDERQFTPQEIAIVEGILGQCEVSNSKLHSLAGAGQAMIDEARAAFGLAEAVRTFRVTAASDSPAESVAVAVPPPITGEEVAALRAEHAELLEQNRQLAAMVEQFTKPATPAEPEPDTPKVEPPRPPQPSQPSRPAPPRPQHKG